MQACSINLSVAAERQYLQAPELSSWLRTQLCCPETSEEGQLGAAPQTPCPSDRSRTWPACGSHLSASQIAGGRLYLEHDWGEVTLVVTFS